MITIEEVGKRSMMVLRENFLFFLVMSLLFLFCFALSFIGLVGSFFVIYFIIRKSLNLAKGIDSKWFDFEIKSFVNFLFYCFLLIFIGSILFYFFTVIIWLPMVLIGKIFMINQPMLDSTGLLIITMFIAISIAFIVLIFLFSIFYFCVFIVIEYPKVGVLNSYILTYKLIKGEVKNILAPTMPFILLGLFIPLIWPGIFLPISYIYVRLKSKSAGFNEMISKYGYSTN